MPQSLQAGDLRYITSSRQIVGQSRFTIHHIVCEAVKRGTMGYGETAAEAMLF